MSILDDVMGRLELGKSRYGHGVRVTDNTEKWGTSKNSWMEMAKEEFLDAMVYVTADYISEGRIKSPRCMSDLEYVYIDTVNPDQHTAPDDNNVIMYILANIDRMGDCRHRTTLLLLFSMLKTC